jgi:hypothetical protein
MRVMRPRAGSSEALLCSTSDPWEPRAPPPESLSSPVAPPASGCRGSASVGISAWIRIFASETAIFPSIAALRISAIDPGTSIFCIENQIFTYYGNHASDDYKDYGWHDRMRYGYAYRRR